MNTSSAPSSDRQITSTPGINNRCKPVSIAKTRWVAYAAAGAATALAGSQSAEAAIHYSGRVNELFLVGEAHTLKLDRLGDRRAVKLQQVGATDPASAHPHQQLAGAGIWTRQIDQDS